MEYERTEAAPAAAAAAAAAAAFQRQLHAHLIDTTTTTGSNGLPTSPSSDSGGSGSGSAAGDHQRFQSPTSHNDRQTSRASPAPSFSSSKPDASSRDRVTVPSACIQCRSKHLKCDGLNPCTRCSSNSFECVYVRSRRGFKGPRRNGLQNKTPAVDRSCPLIHPNNNGATTKATFPSGLATPPDHRWLTTLPLSLDVSLFDMSQEIVPLEPPKPPPAVLDHRERCIEAFFYHFYPAHPFVLPRNTFYALRKEKPLDHLEACMRYVGSFYVQEAPTLALEVEAERSVYHPECQKDGIKVQAMLILAIGLDGYTLQEKALQVLVDAQALALEIGMNKREFAYVNGGGSEVLSESWRRTWWEMYVVDGMIAGVHQQSLFPMKDVPTDVALPCEEKEYATGNIPSPNTLEDFDDESFDGRDLSYSSFAYRIAAIRNLGRVLAAMQVMMLDIPTIDRVDAYLVNWKLHLPASKKDFINAEGHLDEMLFQAHMITEATTILLHREHSELDSSSAQNVTSCAPHKHITPGQTYNIHAAKTIQAAQNISKLIQLPIPLVKHTHFFTCVVTLASVVHLSCWSAMSPLIRDDDLKQQVRLNTGALKTLWQVWPSAGKAFEQVKGVAQEIYTVKKQAAEIGYWADISDDKVLMSMIEDQNMMDEFQLLI